MTIRTVANQYVGINAHLHSYFQSEGGWDSFHANHIADLMRVMNIELLPRGYVADIQQSLQIRRFGEPAGKPESDVTIYDTDPVRRLRPVSPLASDAQTVTIPEAMTIDPELEQYRAVAIYEYEPGKTDPGEPVAWVELLSPSNKPGGQDATYYRDKRLKLLQSGVVFVELDYLHESPPTFDKFPSYVVNDGGERDPDSHPYHIFVVDPRPEFFEGKVRPYHFDVEEPIPLVKIPLSAGDVLEFDFELPYNKTFKETQYGLRFVDYAEQPRHFDLYSRADQVRITHRVYTVLKAASAGKDLEASAPLSLANMGPDEPVGRIGWKGV